MHCRFAVVTVAALLLAACGQSTSTLPNVTSIGNSQGLGASRQVAGSVPKVKFFSIPTFFSWPEYITNGPDGNLWFTEYYGRKVARITTAGVVTEFSLGARDDVDAIVTGPDKNLWFTEPGANQIGRMTTKGVLTDFHIPASNPDPRGIAAGPDGNVWFTDMNNDSIGRITSSGTITQFSLRDSNASPWEIMTGPDGNLWVTDSTSDRISRFNPRTLKLLPSIRLRNGTNPWALTVGRDHRVWFTGRASSSLNVVAHGVVTEFRDPVQGSYPDDFDIGRDRMFYFTQSLRNGIGRFDPETGKFLQRIVLSTKDIPTSIVEGPDGNMWFTNPSYDASFNRIGVVVLH